MRIFISIIFTFTTLLTTQASEYPYEFKNAVYDEYIKTVTLEVNNLPTNFPVLTLNSSEYIMLKFDDLLNEERTLYYRIIHCDKDWKPSRLSEIEYLSGFNDERLRNYSYSINTKIPYLNYWQQFPNKDTRFKVSGNFLLVIYEDRIDFPLLSRRFIIAENKVGVSINGIFPGDVENIRFKQEMQVSINFEKFKMRNPVDEITLLMLQNEDWNTTRESKPSFFSGNNLKFNRLRTFDFWALSEYREFDTRTLFRLGRHINYIERNKNSTDVLLTLDEPRRNKVYLSNFDFNGKFIIDNFERLIGGSSIGALDELVSNIQTDANLRQSLRDSLVRSLTPQNTGSGYFESADERSIRSDYTNVIFALKDNFNYKNQSIYVLGAMNNWTPVPEFEMKYDSKRDIYTTQTLLKQGYYNYYYGVVNNNKEIDYQSMEGSWSDTENEYQAIVYYRGLGDIYDRIIGFRTYNTTSQPYLR